MKKIINLGIVSFTIILVILMVFSFLQNQTFKEKILIIDKKIFDLENQNKELKKQEQGVEKLIFQGWNEYTNIKYYFKIWYPEKIYVSSNGKTEIGVVESPNYDNGYNNLSDMIFFGPLIYQQESTLENGPIENLPGNLFRIYAYNKNITDIKKFIEEESKTNITNNGIKNIDSYLVQEKINNIDTYKFETPNGTVGYYIKKDDFMLVVHFFGSTFLEEDSKNLRPVFDKIIQSFRFTE